jgi:hypothetical protein
MALPVSANLEPANALGLDAIPTPRWTSFQRKMLVLSRNGLTNLINDIQLGSIQNVQCAMASETSLRLAYEGPLSAGYLSLSPQAKQVVDRVVDRALGGNSFVVPLLGLSNAAIGIRLCQFGGDNPAGFRP